MTKIVIVQTRYALVNEKCFTEPSTRIYIEVAVGLEEINEIDTSNMRIIAMMPWESETRRIK